MSNAPEEWVPLGQLVKAALERRRAVQRERLVRHLRPMALDLCAGERVAPEIAADLVFLVAKERLTDFQARFDQLACLFDGEIALHTSDPCYPQAFCAVTVTRSISRVSGTSTIFTCMVSPSSIEIAVTYSR